MIIGVDGGALAINDERLKVGVYTVTERILEKISQLDNSNNYRIYSFSQIGEGRTSGEGKNVEYRVLFPKGYMKIWIPLELIRKPVDVFLGISQVLPKSVLSKKFDVAKYRRRKIFRSPFLIGFVHDLGFLSRPDLYPGSAKKLRVQTDDLISRADRIVAVSDATRRDILRQYGSSVPPISVLYEGVDERFTHTGEKFVSGNPYILFVGALKPAKNVPTLIAAFANFLKSQRKIYDLLLVGGDYWPDPKIYQAVKRYGLTDRVKFTGTVDAAQLPAYYRGAELFVSPSLVEGFGLTVAEAQACGCPVIASSAGSLPEVAGDGGILLKPRDVDGYTKAMASVVSRKDLRTQLVQKGLKNVRRFSWEKFVRGVMGLYPHIDEKRSE